MQTVKIISVCAAIITFSSFAITAHSQGVRRTEPVSEGEAISGQLGIIQPEEMPVEATVLYQVGSRVSF